MVILSFDNDSDLSDVARLRSAVDDCLWMSEYGAVKSGSFSSDQDFDVLRCLVESSDGFKYRCFDVRILGLRSVRAVFNADCSEEIDMVESLIEALIDLTKRKYT